MRVAKVLDIIIIITSYIIVAYNIFSGGETALLAFIWGQLAIFWFFAVYRRKKPVEMEKPEVKTKSKPAEKAEPSKTKSTDTESHSQEKPEGK